MEKTKFLAALLDCGTTDVDFLINQFEKFEVDYGDVISFVNESKGGELNFHNILETIYELAVGDAMDNNPVSDDERDEVWDKCFSPSLNYLDSHLYLETKDGEAISICDYDDIVIFLNENYRLNRDDEDFDDEDDFSD
jgi:hypothetical protein